VLLRALFKMGLPVSGKNLFPSNIQGLPTWFTIRVSQDGYIARRENAEVLVAMNLSTAAEDIQNLPPGGVCLYPQEWKMTESRDDVIYYAMPVKELADASGAEKRMRDYIANMVYVGVLAEVLGIDLNEIENALVFHFKGKSKAVESNMDVVNAAAKWARESVEKRDPYRVKPMQRDKEMLIIDGNSASALGAVFGGVTVAAWYPITPSTGLMDAVTDYLNRMRVDPETGRATFSIIQAEDELSAIGMVLGAGWMGARAMTATSGPGLSLMAENIGLGYMAEIPAVIFDVQRMGPSTGLPTRTSQGDLLSTYFLSHGDTRHVILLPSNVTECFEFSIEAFDLAERLQTPVLVLSDLDLGMNPWMTEPFEYPEKPMDRGKVLRARDLEKLGGFNRYEDVDGDGIPYRTLPGTDHPLAAYFTRGSGHNEQARYTERSDDWERNMARLARKHETARTLVPAPVVEKMRGAKVGIVAYGSSDPPVQEARDQLKARGVKTAYMRVRALPFSQDVLEFLESYDHVYVIENNLDGQMTLLLRMEYPDLATRVRPAHHADGLPLTARWITNAIMEQEG
jgi:2-oxoglutarate ferredoxin oxidoreductase subunit alpha